MRKNELGNLLIELWDELQQPDVLWQAGKRLGIEIPYPQREGRVLNESAAAQS